MKAMNRTVSGALLLATMFGASGAWAQAFTWGHGTFSGGPRFASDDLNLGLGVNAGGTLDSGPYIGGLATYYFGENEETTVLGTTTEASFSALFVMAEGGYDFGLSPAFVLRPTLGLGVVMGFVEVCSNALGGEQCQDDSESEFNGQLGGQALFETGGITLGGELRLLFGEVEAIWLGGNIGTTF